jgi:hypothetical protein
MYLQFQRYKLMIQTFEQMLLADEVLHAFTMTSKESTALPQKITELSAVDADQLYYPTIKRSRLLKQIDRINKAAAKDVEYTALIQQISQDWTDTAAGVTSY